MTKNELIIEHSKVCQKPLTYSYLLFYYKGVTYLTQDLLWTKWKIDIEKSLLFNRNE